MTSRLTFIWHDAVRPLSDYFRQFSRNGRWGACGACPRDARHDAYPEFCEYTERFDHQLTAHALAERFERDVAERQRAR